MVDRTIGRAEKRFRVILQKPPVVILGGGGHAKVVIDILEELDRWDVAGCVETASEGGDVLGYPILGDNAVLPSLFARGIRYAVVAIGDNHVRRRETLNLQRLGFQLINAVSPAAVVSRRAVLGEGIVILPGAVLNVGVRIGDGVIINTSATIDHDSTIGPFAHIAPGTTLAGGVSVGEGALLGVGVRVIPRISIGSWSVVGAGALVLADIPNAVVAFGAPARVVSAAGPAPPPSES